jgi:carbamoyl-phosphate synthase large subunit
LKPYTPHYYSTHGDENERRDSGRRKSSFSGRTEPHRQGIEFDYCCVHAAFALKEEGFETIMVNSRIPKRFSNYDTSDKLYLSR